MRISDWSSDVCSSDLTSVIRCIYDLPLKSYWTVIACEREAADAPNRMHQAREPEPNLRRPARPRIAADLRGRSRYGLLTPLDRKSTSVHHSQFRVSYVAFCPQKKNNDTTMTQQKPVLQSIPHNCHIS